MLYNEKRNDAMDAVCAMAPTGHTVRTPSSALCKLHSWWLGNGETIGNAKLLHHADWIAFLLHGLQGETDHNNALKLGFDPGLGPHGDYPAWMKSLPYASMLPSNVRAPGTKTGAVATTAAMKYFTRPGGCAVIAGTTDSIAAFVAARCTDVGDAVTSLGSSLALKLVSETRVDDSAKGVYSHRLCGESIFSILVRAIILTSSVLFTGSWLVGGSSNLGGWLLRSNFSDDELVELTDLIDLNDAAKEKDVPDYYPGVLMGFGMTVKEATEALCPRPESDSDYLRGEFLFISVWAIVMTSCFIYSHPGLRRGRRGAVVRGDGRHGLVEGCEGVHRGRGCQER
jgi:sugar (pentulose or hexulose) kinase